MPYLILPPRLKKPSLYRVRFLTAPLICWTCFALVGCQRQEAETQVAPAPPVTVIAARKQTVPIETSGIGTTSALESVTVRARVSGFLIAKHFEEGKPVKDGQLLLSFDDANFRAIREAADAKKKEAEAALEAAKNSKRVQIAQAQVLVSQAKLLYAQLEESRGRRLTERGAQTREEYDREVAALKEAQADEAAKLADLEQAKVDLTANVALAQANLEKATADLVQADLNLEYCKLYATVDGREKSQPIHGRAGDLLVKVGNYVDPLSQADLLTIQQLDPLGVDIQASSRFLPEITALLAGGISSRLIIQGDREYPHAAVAYFVDNEVDPTTSTVLVKAKVANPQEELLPGDYVQTRTVIGQYTDAIVVPEKSVIQTQAGPVCYVVDEKGVVSVQPVQAADVYRGMSVLQGGLEAGQKVIVEGLQLVRAGQTVKPEEKPFEAYMLPDDAGSSRRSGGERPRLPTGSNVRLGVEPESAAPAGAPASVPAPTPAKAQPKSEPVPAEEKPAPAPGPAPAASPTQAGDQPAQPPTAPGPAAASTPAPAPASASEPAPAAVEKAQSKN